MNTTKTILQAVYNLYYSAYNAVCREWATEGFIDLIDIEVDKDEYIIYITFADGNKKDFLY